MREISEGDARFIYAMKLVPAKDPGGIGHLGHYSLKVWALFFLALFTDKTVFTYDCYHSTNTLENTH